MHKNKGRVPKQCSKKFFFPRKMYDCVAKKCTFHTDKRQIPLKLQLLHSISNFLHGQSVAWKISSWYTQAEREKFSVFHGATSIIHSLFQLRLTCAYTAVNSSGDLMYCYKRGKKIFQGPKHLIFSGMIKCCFDNHSCVKDWTIMQDRVYTRAKWAHISYWKHYNLQNHLQIINLKTQ